MCYPITFSGFFTSIFSETSVTCGMLRHASVNSHHTFYNGMLISLWMMFSRLNIALKEYKKYAHTST